MEYTPPPFFKRGPTPLVRLLLCSLLSIALLIADARYQYLGGMRQVVAIIVYPLQRLAGAPGAMLDRIGDFFVTQSALRSENARLAEQNLHNAATLQKYQALAAENAHLRESARGAPALSREHHRGRSALRRPRSVHAQDRHRQGPAARRSRPASR